MHHTKLPCLSVFAPSVERDAVECDRRINSGPVARPSHGARTFGGGGVASGSGHGDMRLHSIAALGHARSSTHGWCQPADQRGGLGSAVVEQHRQGGRSTRVAQRGHTGQGHGDRGAGQHRRPRLLRRRRVDATEKSYGDVQIVRVHTTHVRRRRGHELRMPRVCPDGQTDEPVGPQRLRRLLERMETMVRRIRTFARVASHR